ncbi:hypothetical protein H0H93_016208 [Arthromyces matolae]|nr:hypothetical protein H0H93_016208 [Arthromyces matolae]
MNVPSSGKVLPELPPEIWLEIMQFATYIHHQHDIRPLNPFTPRRVSSDVMAPNVPTVVARTKLNLQRVCRAWRALAVRIAFHYLEILSPAKAEKLILALEQCSRGPMDQRHNLGQWTRHVEVYTHARGSNSLQYLTTVFRVLQACPNLRIFSGHWAHPLPLQFFDAISRIFSASLQSLHWNDYSVTEWPKTTAATSQFISSFTALRVLDLQNYGGSGHNTDDTIILYKVQDLILSNTPPSITAASALNLPALRNLTINTRGFTAHEDLVARFLSTHGAFLTHADIYPPTLEYETSSISGRIRENDLRPDIFLRNNLCPRLVALSFPTSSPIMVLDAPHSLRCIGIRGVRADYLYPDKDLSTTQHLMSFDHERYTSLQMIKTVDFLAEADGDSLIKDLFIWWVDRFAKRNVDFLDGEGVLWTYDDFPQKN